MLLMLSVIAALVVGWQVAAFASHPEASLAGSNFEIDTDANLKVDDPAPSTDWASVTEIRATDKPTGGTDDSYQGGVKEDTTCPAETTGSIPNNKSDLRTFHVYREAGTGGHPGFLNLAWSRVTDPTGTTLMDFEFNQSTTNCTAGPDKVRTAGDLLIEYSIDQGGARADITGRTWNGSAWGAPQDLDQPSATCGGNPCAAGTINSTSIPAAQSDGIISTGQLNARTFGEAQLDLRLIFQANKCTSFGSAMLKSRASDSFTSQLKDFIRPASINLTNCGKAIIHKETLPDEDPNTTNFGYTKSFGTDPASANTFQLTDDGTKTFTNVLFGSDYTVTEDVIPANWKFASVDCSASTGVTPTITGAEVKFNIDADTDVLECTYTNEKQLGAIKVTKTRKHAAASNPSADPQSGVDFTVNGVTKKTDANGVACFDGLSFGSHDVVETVPTGYVADGNTTKSVDVNNSASCSDATYGGETVSFSNTPLTNVTVTVDSQVNGGTASTIDCGGKTASTDTNGDGELKLSDLKPNDPDGLTCKIVIDP